MIKEISPEEFNIAVDDARVVAGVLNLMEAALQDDEGRATLNDQAHWVFIDANERMERILKVLSE